MNSTSPFETLEARAQAAVYRACSNCTVVAGSDPFRAIFDNPDTAMDVVTASTPTLRFPTSEDLSGGQAITIDGAAYVISNPPRRLGSGLESIADVVPA